MNDLAQATTRGAVSIAGAELDVYDRGKGAPILFLHGGAGIALDIPFLDTLAKTNRVIAPSHPGFGRSSLPDWLESVDDIAHIYLELMDKLGLDKVDLIGCSLGGWIAGEIVSKVPERVKHLVLIGPVGVKTGSPDKLDVPDVFAMPADKLQRLAFHDPEKWRPDFKSLSDEQLTIIARNRETMALIAWEPYMHNPQLKHRLHRMKGPVLFLRGVSDGIASADYVERYAKLYPNARIVTIPEAGHVPQTEQLAVTTAKILEFLKA
jgi:pimeloyl-ACP methyl ester carboxylesterase